MSNRTGFLFGCSMVRMSEEGQVAMIIVFFVFMMLMTIFFSYLYRMRIEQEATSNYQDALNAYYIAQAGIERAIAELKNDNNHYDDLYEPWAKGFREELGPGYYDIELISEDSEQKEVGIVDEGSKLNINVIGKGTFNEGLSPHELDIRVLEGIDERKLEAILNYRYGPDGAPGKKGVDDDKDNNLLSTDGIDNDSDGEIDEENEGVDEPDEFRPENPQGDDNPFETLDELRLIPGIGEITFNQLKNYITIYSYDKNIDRDGNLRVNINHASPDKIARVLEKAGLDENEAAQIAVNIVDFRDKDNDPTSYKGKLGIERTPYINEVMPFFTTSVLMAVTELIKGGVKYAKDRAKEEIRKRVGEKAGKYIMPTLEKAIDEVTSRYEGELIDQVNKTIEKYKSANERKKASFWQLWSQKVAYASEGSFKMDIEIEWIELYNPYPSICPLVGWKIKTSLRKRSLFGVVPGRGYWLVINVVIKMPEKTIGKELLDNFGDTVELFNLKGVKVDEVTYENYGFPWRAFEKNDPRVREFVGTIPGGSPWFRNWYYMPRVGEVKPEQAETSFYVKNKPFASIGEIGYIHTGKQWKTVNLGNGGEWRVLDRITVSWPVEKPVRGRININTASKKVLESLPYIDSKLAEQIIDYCDGKDGPFDEIGEIAEVRGMQKLGFNGLDDDEDGYVDEDDEREAILRKISNLITVRSNCFTAVSAGRVIRGGKVVAERKIKAVIDRGSSPIKIKYYREIYEE